MIKVVDARVSRSGGGSGIVVKHGNLASVPKHSGTVYNKDGVIVPQSLLKRAGGVLVNFDSPDTKFNGLGEMHLDGQCIYAGWYFRHHGHFLAETLARCWALPKLYRPGTKIIFHVTNEDVDEGVKEDHFDVFETLNVRREDIVLATKNIRVSDLIIPLPGGVLDESIHGIMKLLYDRVSQGIARQTRADKGERIYISRARVPSNKKKAINEKVVEAMFQNQGFKIIYPEELPLAEQLALFRDASVIAGAPGSGIFASVFNQKYGKIICLAKIRGDYMPKHQILLNNLSNCETLMLNCLVDVEGWKNYWADERVISAYFSKSDGTRRSSSQDNWWASSGKLPVLEHDLLEERCLYEMSRNNVDEVDKVLRRMLRYSGSPRSALMTLSRIWNDRAASTASAEMSEAIASITAWVLGIFDYRDLGDRDQIVMAELAETNEWAFFLPTFREAMISARGDGGR